MVACPESVESENTGKSQKIRKPFYKEKHMDIDRHVLRIRANGSKVINVFRLPALEDRHNGKNPS